MIDIHPSYITDQNGKRVSITLPFEEYQHLLEAKSHLLEALIQAEDELAYLRRRLAETIPQQEEDNFFALAGLWEGRDIDAASLRKKAWPERRA